MLRRLISVILILSVISSNFSLVLVCASFELNKKYIAKNLCENRDRPWLHCNGKCVLARKVKKAEEKEAKETSKTTKYEAMLAAVETLVSFETVYKRKVFPHGCLNHTTSYMEDIFHPPSIFS